MINSKKDLNYFLECDRVALRKTYTKPRLIHDKIWTFQILMRKCAYIENTKRGVVWKLIGKYYKYRYVSLGQKLGFSIAFNSFGPGLAIVHYGCTVVHQNARIGENCRIHEGVTIGSNASKGEAPQIGNNVYIGSGAKIIGNVKIADGVVIGANAVVVKDIIEPGITVAGIPAKKISDNNSDRYITRATEMI